MDIKEETSYITSLIISNIILSTISTFFNVFNIIIHIFYFKRKSYIFEFGLYFQIAESLYSFAQMLSIFRLSKDGFEGSIFSNNPKSAICFIQSTIIDYANFASMCWLSFMTYSVYTLLTKNNKYFMEEGRKKFLIIGWGIPVIFTIM